MLASVRRHRCLIALLLLAGCGDVVDPPLPHSAVATAPPSVYTTWWSMTEACSGLHGSMAAITWYVIPNARVVPYPGASDARGYWSLASNRIVLAGDYALDGPTVRHEMLHALLRGGGHPRSEFLGACGGVVDCGTACIADAGPPPPFDPSALRVSEDDLDVAITVAPAHPTAAIDDGFLTLTVHAVNPRAAPIIVALPPRGLDGTEPSATFAYFLTGPAGGVQGGTFALDSADIRFAPHQSKEQVFDFVIGGSFVNAGPFLNSLVSLPAGSYRIVGGYGHHLASDTVQIGP